MLIQNFAYLSTKLISIKAFNFLYNTLQHLTHYSMHLYLTLKGFETLIYKNLQKHIFSSTLKSNDF